MARARAKDPIPAAKSKVLAPKKVISKTGAAKPNPVKHGKSTSGHSKKSAASKGPPDYATRRGFLYEHQLPPLPVLISQILGV